LQGQDKLALVDGGAPWSDNAGDAALDGAFLAAPAPLGFDNALPFLGSVTVKIGLVKGQT
jgi:hypothetical protein